MQSNLLINLKGASLAAALLLVAITSAEAFAQTTAFTYQGKLSDNGNPGNAAYDMQFKLFDAATNGNQIGATLTFDGSGTNPPAVSVSNGIFAVSLDFGVCASCFNGAARFLEIAVRPNGGGSFTTLTPRQPIMSAPYAINAAQLGGLAASGFLQNSTTQQSSSNFNISGDGMVAGTLTGSIVNAVNQVNINGLRAFTVNGAFNNGTSVVTASNTFAGDGAGVNTTPDPSITGFNGKFNTFFGAGAGFRNTSGAANTLYRRERGFQYLESNRR